MAKLLCVSDEHLRLDNPKSRDKEEFLKTQEQVLRNIVQIFKNNNCDLIIHAGDIFNRAKPEGSQELEIMIFDIFDKIVNYYVCGNHDLLFHKFENRNKGSIGVIERYDTFYLLDSLAEFKHFIINGFSYGQEIANIKKSSKTTIAVIHKFISEKELPFFIKDGLTAEELCESYNYDIFITGDNHQGFYYKHPDTDQIVINPGAITRQTVSQKNYKPRVYTIDTETKEVVTHFIGDDDVSVIKEVDEEKVKERDERINSFIEKVRSTQEIELDFESNIRTYCQQNNVTNGVLNIIEEVI